MKTIITIQHTESVHYTNGMVGSWTVWPLTEKGKKQADNIIIVSHGDLLSVFNAMFLGLDVESLEKFELFGLAGGVSKLVEDESGKRLSKNSAICHIYSQIKGERI